MKQIYIKILSSLVVLMMGYAYFHKDVFLPEKKPFIEKESKYLRKLLKETLGIPQLIETSSKTPKIVFIDQVIPHHLIATLPKHQLDPACYDTLDYKDHVIPTFYKKRELIIFPEKEEEQNHCFWMVKGFLEIAAQGDHQIYLPSNSPEPIDDRFVVPYPQWKKVIKRLENNEKFDIINCSYSYGKEIYPHESYEAIKRGSLVIVSAGNDFDKDPQLYQANYTKLYQLAQEMNRRNLEGAMLIVGAYNPFSKELVDYSNRPFKDSSETGEDFVSAPCFFRDGNKAYMNGGTSIAAAYVTAVAALLMKKFPHLTARQIALLLKKTSEWDTGLINYTQAVLAAKELYRDLELENLQPSIDLEGFFLKSLKTKKKHPFIG